MARIPRLTVEGEPAVYHVISCTALDGFVLGDVEKEYLLQLIQGLSAVYFTEVLGFCLMGNHFHLLVRIHPAEEFSDDEIRTRFQHYYHWKPGVAGPKNGGTNSAPIMKSSPAMRLSMNSHEATIRIRNKCWHWSKGWNSSPLVQKSLRLSRLIFSIK